MEEFFLHDEPAQEQLKHTPMPMTPSCPGGPGAPSKPCKHHKHTKISVRKMSTTTFILGRKSMHHNWP